MSDVDSNPLEPGDDVESNQQDPNDEVDSNPPDSGDELDSLHPEPPHAVELVANKLDEVQVFASADDYDKFEDQWKIKHSAAREKYNNNEFELAQGIWHEAVSDALNWLTENNVKDRSFKIHVWNVSKWMLDKIIESEGKRKELVLQNSINWGDIVGLEHAKQIFVETLIWPQVYPELYSKGAAVATTGILLFGPPGTGKSMLARTAAKATGSHFIALSVSNLMSPLQGVSEQLVKNYFDEARLHKPSVIFLDEIESLTSTRRDTSSEGSARVKSELLVQTQLENEGVLLIGATNLPESIDQAFRRRFQKKIYIPMPTESNRKEMLSNWIRKTSHALKDEDLAEIAKSTDTYSSADMFILFQEGIATSIRTKLEKGHSGQPLLTKDDMIKSMTNVKPTVTRGEIRIHERFASKWCIENVAAANSRTSASRFSTFKKSAKKWIVPGYTPL